MITVMCDPRLENVGVRHLNALAWVFTAIIGAGVIVAIGLFVM
jgi:hypothetical protein